MKRHLPVLTAMNAGINKDATTQEKLANGLRKIYTDYEKDRIITNLYGKYIDMISMAYLRKLADLGFVKRMSKSKREMIYIWSAGENPDFLKLAGMLMMSQRIPEDKKDDPLKLDKTIELGILLTNEGYDKEKVTDLTKKIVNIFFPE